jgi:sporulation protein YlmC with PRC-barrel domain
MSGVAEWLAPAATMVAAVMTAANLGARVTGWGFVVFTLGSLGWIVVGIGSGQTSLIITNAFLTLVNAVGIWRWLGRQARYESVGEAAETAGQAPRSASVVAASSLVGRAVVDHGGNKLAEAVEAILDRDTAAIHHLVVRFGGIGGIGEQIVALPIADICLAKEAISTRLSGAAIAELPRLDAEEWPRLLRTDPAPVA